MSPPPTTPPADRRPGHGAPCRPFECTEWASRLQTQKSLNHLACTTKLAKKRRNPGRMGVRSPSCCEDCSPREGKWPRDLEHAAPQHLVPRTSGESQSEGSAETLGSLNEQEERSSEQRGEQQTRAPHMGLQKEHHTAGFNQSEPPPLLLCSARVLEGSCNQRSVSSFTFFLCCCYFSTDSSLCGAWRGRGGGSHSTPLIFSSFTSPWIPFVFSLPCPWRSLGALVQRCLSNVTDVQERLSLCPSLGGCDRAQRTEQNAALAKSRTRVSGFAEWEPGWLAPAVHKRTTGQGVCLISKGPF